MDRVFREHRVRRVYHLAAYAAEGLSHFIRRFNYQNNLIGSVNLINASVNHDVECFVFTSSIAVYGPNQVPMHEELVPAPEDPYGVAKLAVEQDLRACHAQFGLPYVIFRPHNVYGERQNIGDRYRNVIGIFMNQIMRGEPMTIFGDGRQTRAFTLRRRHRARDRRGAVPPGRLRAGVQRRRRHAVRGPRARRAGRRRDGRRASDPLPGRRNEVVHALLVARQGARLLRVPA